MRYWWHYSHVLFFYPLISWQFHIVQRVGSSDIEVPVPKYTLVNKSIFGLLVTHGLTQLTTDFADARSWYPTLKRFPPPASDAYFLSVPKLGIKNGVVSTDYYDLSKHLVQYSGTALPGERGSAVIFGHSSLPQLFSSQNYKTIFATLHTLVPGDEIIVNVEGAQYSYIVEEIFIAEADDTSVFTQEYDASYVTLVTCTPPGTIWKRLIVKSKLQPLHERV
jgi:sortase A